MAVKTENKALTPKILFGIVIILLAIYMIFNTAGVGLYGVKPVSIAGINVISVPNSPITINNNNQLVHATGAPIVDIVLDDPLLGISEKAIVLIRKVEMYQWTQTQEQRNEKLANSIGKETVVYTYKPIWSSDIIDSNTFKDKVNYRNPLGMPIDGLKRKVQDVAIGDFHLSGALIDMITNATEVDLSQLDIGQLQERSKSKVFHDGHYIFVGDDVAHPAIGNIRISLLKVSPSELSVIAQQKENNLDVFALPDGKAIAMVEEGHHSAKEMVEKSALTVWIFNFFGLFMIFFGVFAIFSVTTIHSKIERLIEAIGLYSGTFVIAYILWSIVMIIVEYFNHPWTSCVLILILAALIFFLVKRKKV